MLLAEAEQEFDLSLLSEAELAEDPYPHLPLLINVVCTPAEGGAKEQFAFRTSERQMGSLFDQWRAVRLGLADRGRKRALAETANTEAKDRLLAEANSHLPVDDNPQEHLELLDRVRRGLEGLQGPTPEDTPPGDKP